MVRKKPAAKKKKAPLPKKTAAADSKKAAPAKKKPEEKIADIVPEKHPGGAPSKYDKDTHPVQAWLLAVLGKTNIEIAAGLSISTRTLHDWGKKHPEFLSSVKAGKDIANARVVKALYLRAIGYKVPEKKVIQNSDGSIRKEVTEKDIQPDIQAIKLWLTNRDPKNWKDKVDHEVGGRDGKPIPVKILRGISMEDL